MEGNRMELTNLEYRETIVFLSVGYFKILEFVESLDEIFCHEIFRTPS